jgi:hypothetical protein
MPKLLVLAFLCIKIEKKTSKLLVPVFLQIKLKKIPKLLILAFLQVKLKKTLKLLVLTFLCVKILKKKYWN